MRERVKWKDAAMKCAIYLDAELLCRSLNSSASGQSSPTEKCMGSESESCCKNRQKYREVRGSIIMGAKFVATLRMQPIPPSGQHAVTFLIGHMLAEFAIP